MFINTYKCEYLKGTVTLRIPYELDNVFRPNFVKDFPYELNDCQVVVTYKGSSNVNLFAYNCMQVFNSIKHYFVAS